ncbi:MAG TPA: hypothetical protein GX525_05510 [Bacilli bacterium]|nr:hypothetical protein [Bacilli bacterium]
MKKRKVFLCLLMAIVMLLSMGSVGFTKTQSVDTPSNLKKVKLNEYELLNSYTF